MSRHVPLAEAVRRLAGLPAMTIPQEEVDGFAPMPEEERAAQDGCRAEALARLREALVAGTVRALGRRGYDDRRALGRIPRDDFAGSDVVILPGFSTVFARPKAGIVMNGPPHRLWRDVEIEAEGLHALIPPPTRAAAVAWMTTLCRETLERTGRVVKQRDAARLCKDAIGYPQRDGEAAFSDVPHEYRNKPGRPRKAHA